MDKFRTHTGEIVRGKRLHDALEKVARDYRRIFRAIYKEDDYAPHVTPAEKLKNLRCDLILAHRIRTGRATGAWLWQDVNTVLTGECIPLLPMYKSRITSRYNRNKP